MCLFRTARRLVLLSLVGRRFSSVSSVVGRVAVAPRGIMASSFVTSAFTLQRRAHPKVRSLSHHRIVGHHFLRSFRSTADLAGRSRLAGRRLAAARRRPPACGSPGETSHECDWSSTPPSPRNSCSSRRVFVSLVRVVDRLALLLRGREVDGNPCPWCCGVSRDGDDPSSLPQEAAGCRRREARCLTNS